MNDAATRQSAQIAEMIDQDELDGPPDAGIPGFDDDVNTGPPPLPEPADMAFGGPDEVADQVSSEAVTMSRDFLYELLRLTKERAGGPCDTCDDDAPIGPEFEEPGEAEAGEEFGAGEELGAAEEFGAESDITMRVADTEEPEGGDDDFGAESESEGEESEGEESEDEESDDEEVEVEEGKKKRRAISEAEGDDDSEFDGPPSDTEDDDTEEGDTESDGPPPELDDSDEDGADSIPFEPGAEAGAEIDADIDDADPPDGGLNHADIEEVVSKLVELSAGGETLTMHDLPEIVQCCFPDPVSDIGDMDEPPIDEPPIDEPPIDGPPIDEPPIDGPPIDEPPIDDVGGEEPPIDDVGGEGPPEDLPFESMKPVDEMSVIDEKLAKTKAINEHNESAALAKSIAGFAKKLKINVAMKPAKSENGAEYLGDEETFPKLCEAINKTLATIKEGKKKATVGAMSKYSRCYPVSGAGRLFYVFK